MSGVDVSQEAVTEMLKRITFEAVNSEKEKNMKVTDKIVEILDKDRKWPDAKETAEAIVAALPDIIPDLVWVEDGWWRHSAKPFPGYLSGAAFWIMHTEKGWLFASAGKRYGSLQEAKAAANAHHKAALARAMGWTS